jgi:Xaa-Pro aminopeptidase
MPRAVEETPIENVLEIRSVRGIPGVLLDFRHGRRSRVGLELDVLPVRDYRFFETLLPFKTLVDGSPLIHQIRVIKSDWEMAQMDRTAEISDEAFHSIRSSAKPGIDPMDLIGRGEIFARKYGHGNRLRIRNYQAGGWVEPWEVAKCGDEGPLIVRFRCVHNGYHVDEARTLFPGKPSLQSLALHDKAVHGLRRILERVRPAVPLNELIPRRPEESTGGFRPVANSVFCHGIGLELVEPPPFVDSPAERLRPGMTLALTSKTSTANHTVAVEVGVVLCVTDDGYRLVSKGPLEAP